MATIPPIQATWVDCNPTITAACKKKFNNAYYTSKIAMAALVLIGIAFAVGGTVLLATFTASGGGYLFGIGLAFGWFAYKSYKKNNLVSQVMSQPVDYERFRKRCKDLSDSKIDNCPWVENYRVLKGEIDDILDNNRNRATTTYERHLLWEAIGANNLSDTSRIPKGTSYRQFSEL